MVNKRRPHKRPFELCDYPKLLPQELQCHVLLTDPAAKTPKSATLPTFEAVEIFFVFDELQ